MYIYIYIYTYIYIYMLYIYIYEFSRSYKKSLSYLLWVSHIHISISHLICVIITQITWPSSGPYYLHQSQIFNKIDSFLKFVLNVFNGQKGRLHLWRTVYLLLLCVWQQKTKSSWRNFNLNHRLRFITTP